VHAQGVGAFAQVESGLEKSGRRRNGRMILQVVNLCGQRVHSVTEGLKLGVALRLCVAGAFVHLAQQAMGAIDREQADRGTAEYQAT
jgi:hypothetical protein